MGTRGLIVLKYKNIKYVMYNQYDSYPSYLGVFVANLIDKYKDLSPDDFFNVVMNHIVCRKLKEQVIEIEKNLQSRIGRDDKEIEKLQNQMNDISYDSVYKSIFEIDPINDIDIDDMTDVFIEWVYSLNIDTGKFSVYGGYYKPVYNINDFNALNWFDEFQAKNEIAILEKK